jgi:hypothetical protein
MQSVAADEKKAHALAERFSDAACSKSWVLRRVWRGRRLASRAAVGGGGAAGLSGGVRMSEPGETLAASKSPIRLVSPSSFWMRDGAWMLLYAREASRPAYRCITVPP